MFGVPAPFKLWTFFFLGSLFQAKSRKRVPVVLGGEDSDSDDGRYDLLSVLLAAAWSRIPHCTYYLHV